MAQSPEEVNHFLQHLFSSSHPAALKEKEEVGEFARKEGCYNVTLNVWSCNPEAMGFYEKCGLQVQKIGMETIL